VPRRLADTRRARDEIGFVAEVPLEDGLRRLAAWRKETLAREETRV
jgi:UDP-glucose 4-epimerase